MKYISLPHNITHRLPFYLAMEEFVARNLDEDECFFMWQVAPTVIFGRNQLIENEVNLDYCRTHGIQTYRRKSGGGCVYADPDNIMFSYVQEHRMSTLHSTVISVWWHSYYVNWAYRLKHRAETTS